MFPYILNLATRARISANATCGKEGPEYFCKLVEHVDLMPQISHCDYCNAHAGAGRLDQTGAPHPVEYAIDGSNRWWQSPSISNGWEYNYVTLTLDLGLVNNHCYILKPYLCFIPYEISVSAKKLLSMPENKCVAR